MKRTFLFLMVLCILGTSATAATVAYWRFEEGPAGTNVQSSATGPAFSPDLVDSSGNGNFLSAWDSNQWQFRANVAYDFVPWTGAENNLSIKNVTGSPTLWNESLATWGPAQWTIEATFKAENGGYKTIVGRDSQGTATQNGDLSALYFQTTDNPAMGLAIKFCDVAGYWHEVVVPDAYQGFDFGTDPEGTTAPWYTMVATSDGTWLRLYLYEHDNPEAGYQEIGSVDMSLSGSPNTALTTGGGEGGDWQAGNITVGRGMYAGGHGDRFYGYLDEIRLSDVALAPSEFLLSPGYVQTAYPAQDQYLPSTAPITYEWTADVDRINGADILFDSYQVYIAADEADLAPSNPTTTLDSVGITDINATTYSGYSGTYDYNEDYYWRVDMIAFDPNSDPNIPDYDVLHKFQGAPVRFFGPRACPAVTISDDVSNLPDADTHIFTAQDAVFTASIDHGTVDVDAISWYKVVGMQDKLNVPPDPNDAGPDIEILNVPGDTEITYTPDLTTATETTLTIVNADPLDNGEYYAYVRLVDPLGGGSGCADISPTADLFVRDDTNSGTDYLVHRYGFNGDATDSIGSADGVVADLDGGNHVFADGQIELINTDLTSGPTEAVQIPSQIPGEPNETRDLILPQEGAYVDLPNGLISPLGKSATFMVWFTFNSADNGNWPRVFDLGTSAGGEGFATGGASVEEIEGQFYVSDITDEQEYTMLTPKVGAGPAWRFETRVVPEPGNVATEDGSNADFADGSVEACVACVFDGATGVQTLYLNGVQVAQTTGFSADLADITDNNNWLGRSQFNDAMFTGKINEFRIYDIPLNAAWVMAYYQQGADDYSTTPNPCVYGGNDMDFNGDCAVNLTDFAEFAKQWLYCGNLYGCD